MKRNENGILIDLYVASIIGYKLKNYAHPIYLMAKMAAQINITINFKWNECF